VPASWDSGCCSWKPQNWRYGFMLKSGLTQLAYSDMIRLLSQIPDDQLDVIKTGKLRNFSGELGFTLEQGQ
jgi:isocitrate dehydrogenase